VVYLASDESSYSTGSEFVVDGGTTAGLGHKDFSRSRLPSNRIGSRSGGNGLGSLVGASVGVGQGEGTGRCRTCCGHQNHLPSSAAMDGVISDRTISVSKSRPRPMVVPTWPMTVSSLTDSFIIGERETSPADVTTDPVPPIDRMMPVFKPAWISSLNRATMSRLLVGADGKQDDDRHREHHPLQFNADEVLPDQYRKPKGRSQRDQDSSPRSPPTPRHLVWMISMIMKSGTVKRFRDQQVVVVAVTEVFVD